MMVDVSNINMKTTLLGHEVSFPICVAPTGMHKLAHPDGELATAKGSRLTYTERKSKIFFEIDYMPVTHSNSKSLYS